MITAKSLRADALIVGGGPAGLAAAIAIQSAGLSCVVVEAQPPSVDKACGEGLMPDAIHALRSLGVTINEGDGARFRGIHFLSGRNEARANFPAGCGYGVRRTRLHERLVQRAEQLGVQLCWNTRAKLIDRHNATLGDSAISFRWLVGADGASSHIRKWAGLDAASKYGRRLGFRRHYETKPWSDYVEVHWSHEGQLYITPVSRDVVCVVFLSNSAESNANDPLKLFPRAAERLASAPLVGRQRGGVSVTRKLRRVNDQTIALVGDASGSTDAVTGEGLAMSFRQALALADAIKLGSLQTYALDHQRIGKMHHRMGSIMLAMGRWPMIGQKAIAALQARSEIFEQLIAVHMGEKSLTRTILDAVPRLGWELMTNSRRSQ